MCEQKMEDLINDAIVGDAQKNALEFVAYLRANEMEFDRNEGYWEHKLYWAINFYGKNVCYILIYTPASAVDSNEPWVVWSDDSGSNWFENVPFDEHLKVIAWENVDICGNCGSCSIEGARKTIFGKELDNVCGTTFRFNNPNAMAVTCLKRMVEIRKNDILMNMYCTE